MTVEPWPNDTPCMAEGCAHELKDHNAELGLCKFPSCGCKKWKAPRRRSHKAVMVRDAPGVTPRCRKCFRPESDPVHIKATDG